MKIKMKRCTDCKTLVSNSAKVCPKCGSRQLEKGVYSDEPQQSIINIRSCLTCGAGVATTLGYGECSFCGDELSSNGSSYYLDYIDNLHDK